MQRKIRIAALAGAALACFCGSAGGTAISGQGTWETTLEPRYFDTGKSVDGYYDSALDITWLADANYARTSDYDGGVNSVGWLLTWDEAETFVSTLDFGPGLDNWRLPDTAPLNGTSYINDQRFDGSSDVGYNVSLPGTTYGGSTASEMAHMYYNTLGNLGFYDTSGTPHQPGFGLTNTGPFRNLVAASYWSQNRYQIFFPPFYDGSWAFGFGDGSQGVPPARQFQFVWAVHDGDVGASVPTIIPMPEPSTMALLGAGLVGLGFMRRRITAGISSRSSRGDAEPDRRELLAGDAEISGQRGSECRLFAGFSSRPITERHNGFVQATGVNTSDG